MARKPRSNPLEGLMADFGVVQLLRLKMIYEALRLALYKRSAQISL
jgi:hypothetical protein